MKEMYVSPVIEVIEYEVADVITTSGIDLAATDNEFSDNWDGIA